MSGSVLPPDIREKMGHAPPRGVGGGASENAVTSQQREAVMNPDVVPSSSPAVEETSPSEESSSELKECRAPYCSGNVEEEWGFCPRCGTDQESGSLEEKLGIKLSEDDISDYLFRGYITREVKILGKHKATMKSAQPKDLDAIDRYIMEGDWAKEEGGGDRKVSDFFMRQVNAMCQTAACVVKIDGESIGDTLEARMQWLLERGSSFVDILSQKVSWYNQALTEYLKKEDSLLGS